jgi:sodium-dependent phosphate cotransporter
MVGADILDVENAIPMVMGANIGTSVTNTIVAHAHLVDHTEFVNGIKGATVHDAFNWLTVLTFLPLEVITQAIGAGLLYSISDSMADGLVGASASTFTSPVKIIVGPLSKAFIKIDKNIIKGIAKGCIECTIKEKDIDTGSEGTIGDTGCKDDSRKDKQKEKIKMCVPPEQWTETYEDGRIVSGGFVKGMGDTGGSVFILIVSLIFLCIALYGIVRVLHHLVLSSGRVQSADGAETPFVRYTRKVLRISPYLSILFGMLLTICVQSSSITTSALTPLVALQIITVEDMLPLTLGANIGTTCTAFLAAIVTEKKSAIQIALCHLWFNIFGIIIWFPVPIMRAIPLKIAGLLAERTVWYKWFGTYYILTFFVVFPLLLFAFSFAIDLGPGGVFLNIILDVLLIAGIIVATWKIDKLATLLKLPAKNEELPMAKQENEAKVEQA